MFFGGGGAHVAHKSGVGGAKLPVVEPGFMKAELAIDSAADFESVIGILAVVFPPAHGAELHRAWSRECLCCAAGAAKLCKDHRLVRRESALPDYVDSAARLIILEGK